MCLRFFKDYSFIITAKASTTNNIYKVSSNEV